MRRTRTTAASYLALPVLALAFAAGSQAQPVFNISFTPSAGMLTADERANIESHLREAGRRWAQVLGVSAPHSIELQVGIAAIPTANGSSAATAFVGVVNGRNTYEQGVAHELRTGIDPNGTDPDGLVNSGLNYLRNELWFDPDPHLRLAPVPANRTDAMSVALHELGHAIAYNGWADLTTGVPPDTFWSTFDRWMLPGSPTVITGPQSVQAWGTPPDVTTGNNKHWGNAVFAHAAPPARRPTQIVEWRNGAPVPLPGCDLPMSIDAPPSHDRHGQAAASASLIDELMNGVVFYRGIRYDISPLDRALMFDAGALVDPIFEHGFEAAP